jgi:hypothetical protein
MNMWEIAQWSFYLVGTGAFASIIYAVFRK